MTTEYRNQTQNFVWDKSQILGHGRVGYVFKGAYKSTQESVAVKCLTQDGMRRTADLHLREFEILKRLKHENIVKIIAIEEELFPTTLGPTGKMVIIMELCMGGSLGSVLAEPENQFGLPEDEFLTLFEHLTRVVRYMRDNNISHRDLKPANILKFIGEDGQIVYKVTDFDTARDIDEDEPFASIVGTPQYAHPDMYSRYLHRSGTLCSSSVELWSIGATLYEAATGRLPFKPFDWRDSCTMLTKILNEKPSGVISGEQRTANGAITWSNTMPKDCLLSEGLKQLLCPLFVGLFERKKTSAWTYQAYFDMAQNILDRKRIHIFYLNHLSFVRVYLDTKVDKGYNNLLDRINDQVNIPVANQMILFKDATLLSILGTESTLGIPSTTEDTPLILCDKDESNIAKPWSPTSRVFKPFQNVQDMQTDGQVATRNMILCYFRKREFEKVQRTIQVFNSAVLTINQVVVSQLMGVSKEHQQINGLIQSLENQLDMMNGFHKSCLSFIDLIPDQSATVQQDLKDTIESMGHTAEKCQTDFRGLKNELTKLTPALDQLLHGRVGDRSLILHWENLSRQIPQMNNINGILTTGLKLINKLERSYEIMRLGPQEQQQTQERAMNRRMERLVMSDTCQILHAWSRKYFELFNKAVDNFSEWYNTAQAAIIQPEILMQNVKTLSMELRTSETEINKIVRDFQSNLNCFTLELSKLHTNRALQVAARDANENRVRKVNAESLKELKGKISEQMLVQQDLKKDWDEHIRLEEELDKMAQTVTAQLTAKLKMIE